MNLKRNDGSTKLQVGEYIPQSGTDHWCVWKCPKCEKLAYIARRVHTVSYFGEITPNVKCPNAQCLHEDNYWLEGWIPEAKGNA